MKKVYLLFVVIFVCISTSVIYALDKVDINTASLAQLDTLTGIGPTYAQRIIDDRPYYSIDDLDRVKGIGPATIQKIKDQGIACVNCQTTQEVVQPVATPPTQTTPPPAVIYTSEIFINEILPNPKGSDETDEWIEIYNSNDFEVDLSGWKLQDTNGTPTTYIIPQATKISAKNFLVFKRPNTNIMLNNDKDGLNLLTPGDKIIDSVSFTSAPLGQSFDKTNSLWQWSTTLTPGLKNIITGTQKTNSTIKTLSKIQNSVKNDGVADLSQSINTNQDNNENNPWFLFLTALAVTIVLAITVLFIKLKIKNHVRT